MKGPGWGIVALIAVVCVFIGGTLGFFVGLATSEIGKEFMSEVSLDEDDADVSSPNPFSNSLMTFQHPGNWTPDFSSGYYDREHYFCVDTLGGSYAEFTVEEFDSDPQENLDAEMIFWDEYFNKTETTSFSRYGSYEGVGIMITGRSLGISETVRIFSHSANERTLIVVEYFYDMDQEMVQPGFDLIERTLKLK